MGNWSIKDLYLKTESRSSNCPVSGFWFLKAQDATARNQKLTKPPRNHNSASVNAINEFTDDSGGRQKIWQFLWFDNRDKRSRILFAHITISGSSNDIHIVVMLLLTVTGTIGLCFCLHNCHHGCYFSRPKQVDSYAMETSPSGTFAIAAAAQT